MESQELRKGNLVSVYNIIHVVEGYIGDKVYVKKVQEAPCEIDEIDISLVEPITLTEELTIKESNNEQ